MARLLRFRGLAGVRVGGVLTCGAAGRSGRMLGQIDSLNGDRGLG